MPIQINELQIKVTVNEPRPEAPKPAGEDTAGTSQDTQALVTQCIEQVLSILEHKKER